MIYLIVGLFGVLGALSRYGIGVWVTQQLGYASMFATLPVNLAGCLILGWFTAYSTVVRPGIHPWLKAGFGTGFVGAFTTFSTFSVETMTLLQNGHWVEGLLYVLCSLWGGLVCAWAGHRAGLRLAKPETDGDREVEPV